MFKHTKIMSLCSILTFSIMNPASAHTPDDHAPIGLMAEHNHKQGEWMTSYRYSRMEMKGNRSGTNDLTPGQVLNNFMVTPLDMTMEMHMFGLMYGVTDKLTLMGMVPYIRKSMNHVTRMGVLFNTETEGLGDFKISGIYTLFDSGAGNAHGRTKHKLLMNLGGSLPTGSIDEHGDTPAGANQKLPYPMQLGSGTFDPLLGFTYINRFEAWSWGAGANTTQRFGKNSEGYRLGSEYGATLWGARNLNEYVSLSLRLDGKSWGNIHGRDIELNPAMVPTSRTDLRGGERVDVLMGANFYIPKGSMKGHRLALEFGLPIYQRLDGPQLETDYRFTLGWQLAF